MDSIEQVIRCRYNRYPHRYRRSGWSDRIVWCMVYDLCGCGIYHRQHDQFFSVRDLDFLQIM